jgi:hypothetical protein
MRIIGINDWSYIAIECHQSKKSVVVVVVAVGEDMQPTIKPCTAFMAGVYVTELATKGA